MRKLPHVLLSVLLSLCMIFSLCIPASADDGVRTVSIRTAQELLTLAQDCRLDSYSEKLTVRLENDIDLSGTEFSGIPIFSGFFDGNGHKISGISIMQDGSDQGFFRYLTDAARVESLTLSGTVSPSGSSRCVGGLVGSNAGSLRRCHVEMQVAGTAAVGGIAGENTVSGLMEDCVFSGTVSGDHFIGGVAGTNDGLLRSCRNEGAVCTTARDEAADLSSLSVHTLTGSEAVSAVTDIGGLAGTNNGFIRACQNHGAVGYPHVGYNVGGIAGSQKGSMADCRNFSSVCGRKEVGGIVGQLEPVSRIEYQEDSLQILRQQLGQTIALADRASSNASGSAQSITGQIDSIRRDSRKAKEAAGQMVIRPGKPLPDLDQLKAASSTLTSSLTSMKDTTVSLGHTTEAAFTGLTGDLQALVSSMKNMQTTLDHVTEHLGGTVTDVSDLDTEEEFTSEISACRNDGPVSGDLNIGGIAGAIAQENDLDPEDDLQFSGRTSLNFSGELRSVIRDCSNFGSISGKKWNAGGIVGVLRLGLVHSCTSSGAIDAPGADYVGGIAGQSAGFLRCCSAKSQLTGRSWVGGIAGTAQIVTDCRSMSAIEGAKERSGAVIGQIPEIRLKDELELKNNVYFPALADIGGIDGVSYQGAAVPLPEQDFLALPELSPIFSRAAVTFRYEDGTEKTVTVPTGTALTDIPAVPRQDGVTLEWENLVPEELEHIYFDRTYQLAATPCRTTVESSAKREDGRPVLLIEGLFADAAPFDCQILEAHPELPEKQTFLECRSLPGLPSTSRLRISVPEGSEPELTRVYLRSADGSWQAADAEVSGSYLVVEADGSMDALALAAAPAPFPWALCLGGIGAGAACIFLLAFLLIRRRRKKNKKS